MNHAVDLNSFYGYAPAIDPTTGVRGPVRHPSELPLRRRHPALLRRLLTLETFPNGAYTTVNHLDIAVSQTANPTGSWNIYRIDVTKSTAPTRVP